MRWTAQWLPRLSARQDMKKADIGQFKVYNLQRQFIAFLENAGLREEQVPGGRGEVVFYNLGKFSQAISDFESIHFHSNPVEKYASFAGFLRHHAESAYPEGWQDNAFVSPDAVRIMTVHQAKGLQWPVVFIPQLVRNRFPVARRRGPHRLAPDPGRSIRQRRPLPGRRRGRAPVVLRGGDARAEVPAHELGAARGQSNGACAVGLLQRGARVEVRETSRARLRRTQTARARARRRRSPTSTLSFSDLKYFFECPYQFKLRILYGFNAPLDEALGFGKSLHDALAEVHARALRGEAIVPGEAAALVQRHLRAPYAYPALREKLEQAARRVIEGYIRKNAADFKNLEFSEKAIEIALGDGVSVAGPHRPRAADRHRRGDDRRPEVQRSRPGRDGHGDAAAHLRARLPGAYRPPSRLRRDLRAGRPEAEAPLGRRRLHRRRQARRAVQPRQHCAATTCRRSPTRRPVSSAITAIFARRRS